MKNQNDIIFSVTAIVVALIVATVLFFTKREPVAPAPPTQVNLTPPQLPTGEIVMSDGLPSGSTSGSAGGAPAGLGAGRAGGGKMGGPQGVGGPSGGPAQSGVSATGGPQSAG